MKNKIKRLFGRTEAGVVIVVLALVLIVGVINPTAFFAKDNIIGVEYMKESDIVEVVTDTTDGTILYAEMPVKTNLRVTHSEPGIKGDTATNATKPATLETGVEIRVPLFINEGDLIQVDTRDGSYLSRVKE